MMDGKVLVGVVEQPGADAHIIIVTLENLEMPATLAALPELGIVRKFTERNWTETEFIIHLHHGGPRAYGEYLGIGEQGP